MRRATAAVAVGLAIGAVGPVLPAAPAAADDPAWCLGESQYGKPGYVCNLYEVLLDRWPDQAGQHYWAGVLGDTQTSRLRAIRALAYSSERRGQLVRSIYADLLGRVPSEGEIAFWRNYLGTGGKVELFEAWVFGSPEYYARAGSLDEGIRRAHTYVLGREATLPEVIFWRTRISGGLARSEFARSLIRSEEGREAKVDELYSLHLGRPADSAGMTHWKAELATGASWLQVQNSLLASNERFSFFLT